MAASLVTAVAVEVLSTNSATNARVSAVAVEVIVGPESHALVTALAVEVLLLEAVEAAPATHFYGEVIG